MHYLKHEMKKPYTYFIRDWVKTPTLFFLLGLAQVALAQEGSQGNTTIFGGAQMTFFANHNFITGGGGTQPGVILTERAAGNFGVLNFSGANLMSIGASDAGYVDGYVRKYGTGKFIFPVGDNGKLGQFAASADGTLGAYFHTDPNSATTTDLISESNYPALPAGGPFDTSKKGNNLEHISTIEYWDIDGTNLTPITLTWDATSAIAALTTNDLNLLVIVGWNGTEWVSINSIVDETSVLGGTSDFTEGSITTTTSIAPNTYTAYTFGALHFTLPVTLNSFQISLEGTTAQLKWVTTAETQSDYFEVEHSINGNTWQKIGKVNAYGNSNILRDYHFTDPLPVTGQNLYRLKMVDQDGSFTYSRIRTLNLKDASGDLSIYPNPSSDILHIRDFSNVKEIVISDLQGRSVYQSAKISKSDGSVNIQNLAQGIYIVKITRLNEELAIHKIVVNKSF
jgi:hypothetical protein